MLHGCEMTQRPNPASGLLLRGDGTLLASTGWREEDHWRPLEMFRELDSSRSEYDCLV